MCQIMHIKFIMKCCSVLFSKSCDKKGNTEMNYKQSKPWPMYKYGPHMSHLQADFFYCQFVYFI